jgi:hypothetical protein
MLTIKYFGVEGTGKTVTAAKADAGRKIESALEGSYSPMLVSWRGQSAVVYRTPDGWGYALVNSDRDGVHSPCTNTSHADRADAIASAKQHVAMNAYDWRTDGPSVDCPLFTDGLPLKWWRDRTASDHRFQSRYASAKLLGYTDSQCHEYACGGYDPELTAEIDAKLSAA